jgi:hypothetical protein
MCQAQQTVAYLQGQGHSWRSKINIVIEYIFFQCISFLSIKGFWKYLAQMFTVRCVVHKTQTPTFKIKVTLGDKRLTFCPWSGPHLEVKA